MSLTITNRILGVVINFKDTHFQCVSCEGIINKKYLEKGRDDICRYCVTMEMARSRPKFKVETHFQSEYVKDLWKIYHEDRDIDTPIRMRIRISRKGIKRNGNKRKNNQKEILCNGSR